jgi:hypothetical protein
VAATVTVDVSGVATTYTLESLSINAQGNVSIKAAGGNTSGGGTPVDPTPVDPAPVDPVDPNPPVNPGTGCADTDTLKCVTTTVGEKAGNVYPSTTVRPAPSLVTAYRFQTLAGTSAYAGSAIATRMTGAIGKRVVISAVAGDMSTADKGLGCYAESTEVSSVSYVVNSPGTNKVRYCHLNPGQTYYVNVGAGVKADGKPNCSSETNCAHLFELK